MISRTAGSVPTPIDHGRSVRGFTLLELLVVLLIMGFLAGLVSVASRPDERAMLHIEAERLGRLLDLAAEEARYSGKPIAWSADERGYRFWRLLEPGWSEILDNDLLRARTLPAGVTFTRLWAENMRPPQAMRLEFVPYGTFAYAIEMSLGSEHYIVSASPIGIVQVAPGEASAAPR